MQIFTQIQEGIKGEFTKRQEDVIRELLKGKTTNDIARSLWITSRTVEKHLTYIYRQIGAANRAQAIVILLRDTIKDDHSES